MKVFIVTSGSYSDYRIEAVFSTKEKAQEYIQNACVDDVNDIEEYEMDEQTERKNAVYHCSVDIKTSEIEVEGRYDDEYKMRKKDEMVFRRLCGDGGFVYFYIETDTLDKARKITAERWQQVRALGNVLFPRLFEKCVVSKYNIYNTSTRYCNIDYPVYNFVTKEIILRDNEILIEDAEKEKKRLKKEGFIVIF